MKLLPATKDYTYILIFLETLAVLACFDNFICLCLSMLTLYLFVSALEFLLFAYDLDMPLSLSQKYKAYLMVRQFGPLTLDEVDVFMKTLRTKLSDDAYKRQLKKREALKCKLNKFEQELNKNL